MKMLKNIILLLLLWKHCAQHEHQIKCDWNVLFLYIFHIFIYVIVSVCNEIKCKENKNVVKQALTTERNIQMKKELKKKNSRIWTWSEQRNKNKFETIFRCWSTKKKQKIKNDFMQSTKNILDI